MSTSSQHDEEEDREDSPDVVFGGWREENSCGWVGHSNRPVEKLRGKLLEAYMAVPDKPFCSGQAEGTPPAILVAKDGAEGQQYISASLAQLEALGQPAQCGRGEETVTDPTVRSTTVIKPPAVAVEWPGLEAALESVRCQQACGPLRAELHDVLVYGEHDFFKEHRDSKKMPQHIMTLVVECSVPVASKKDGKDTRMTPVGGSTLRFFTQQLPEDGPDPEESCNDTVTKADDPRVIEEWEGAVPGDWCCWYCTQPHEVLRLKREGVRVAAVFNVMACGTAAADVKAMPDLESPDQSVCLADPHLALSVNPARDLHSRCETLIRHLQETPILTKNKDPLDHVGFLLWHPYARDVPPAQVPDRRGELPPPLQVPVEHLRGRDVFLVDALRRVTGQTPLLIQTHVMLEVHTEVPDASSALHVPLDVLPASLFKNRAHKPVKKRGDFKDYFTFYEMDDPIGLPAITRDMPPLVHGFPIKYAAKLRSERSSKLWCNIWGNQGHFDFYWYHTVMAVVTLKGGDPKSSFLEMVLAVKPKREREGSEDSSEATTTSSSDDESTPS